MAKLRVLVVDDSALFRRVVSDVLASDPEIEVVGSAPNGRIALQKIPQVNPDVITLDVEMPEMDGLATLAELRKTWPRLPVIMFSSLTERAAAATVDALLLGATDCVAKPRGPDAQEKVRTELLPKVKASARPRSPRRSAEPALAAPQQRVVPLPTAPPAPLLALRPARPEVLTIGVSTGGPNALAEVFAALPGDLPVPVLVVQHMPPMFTRILAERLSSVSALPVREATDGDRVLPGQAWIAPGNFHMVAEREGLSVRLRLNQEPPENSCRPAVDVLFRSVARVWGRKTLALVMTGMGQDGLRGAELIREAGGEIWAQDEQSSVVWGMPGYVARAGLAERILPLDQLGPEAVRRIARARGSGSAE